MGYPPYPEPNQPQDPYGQSGPGSGPYHIPPYQQAGQHGPPPAPGYSPPAPSRPSGGGGLVVGIALAAIVLLGATGVAVFLLAIREDDPAPSAPTDPLLVPSEFAGTWDGRMHQFAPDGTYHSEWDLRLDLHAGESSAGGELFETDGTHMCDWDLTVEHATVTTMDLSATAINDRRDNCVDTVEVTLELTGDGRIEASIDAPWPQGTSTASGTLR